ncbi:hypothetical protein Franean1_0350 [Parafrankia sp. EAN1pec]|nr:hypothetical protein Franean1_0350 [Frankia sp. EAN1pec]
MSRAGSETGVFSASWSRRRDLVPAVGLTGGAGGSVGQPVPAGPVRRAERGRRHPVLAVTGDRTRHERSATRWRRLAAPSPSSREFRVVPWRARMRPEGRRRRRDVRSGRA